MKVSSPDGTTWRVTRRWVPWRRRLDGDFSDGPSMDLGGLGDDPVSVIVGIIAFVVLIPFLVVALVVSLELLLLLLLVPFAVLGRVLLGRQWTVEVRRGWKPWTEVPAGDWQASTLRIHDLADALRRGQVPPQTLRLDSGDDARS